MNPRTQKHVWEQVADFVFDRESGVTRADIARVFHITKSTAMSHLEKGVQRGLLFKVYAWAGGNSRGWVYYHQSLVPMGMTQEEESEWLGSLQS